MTGRTGRVSCPGHARPRVPFPRQSPYLCTVWFADPDTSASESNHTLISDRLPDPAQFARCYRILITLVACEGSHSSGRKVTLITRPAVYLIQSGRKPSVSCRFPGWAVTVRRARVLLRGVVQAGVAVIPLGGHLGTPEKRQETPGSVQGREFAPFHVIRGASRLFVLGDGRAGGSGGPALRRPSSSITEAVLWTGEPADCRFERSWSPGPTRRAPGSCQRSL